LIDEVLDAIAQALARAGPPGPGPLSSGRRAALWRAQHEAARRGASLEELRRQCIDWLARPRLIGAEHESDYVRGYRQGLQLVLREIRAIETVGAPPARGRRPA
jgi:hypothetical protein